MNFMETLLILVWVYNSNNSKAVSSDFHSNSLTTL
jgi:hypothetical protein